MKTRIMYYCLVASLLVNANVLAASQPVKEHALEDAIIALRDEPTNRTRFESLIRLAATTSSSTAHPRALAICYLGYQLSGDSANAEKAKDRLAQQYPNSHYLNYASRSRVFDESECPNCGGTGYTEVPCTKCSDGKCKYCNGRGTKEGISSEITCTACGGTGACRHCNGEGHHKTRCRTCNGHGTLTRFKKDETKQLYLSLLQEPFTDTESSSDSNDEPSGSAPIVLQDFRIEAFNARYNEATSLNRAAIYQDFLREIGSDPASPRALLQHVPDGLAFVVKDVDIEKDRDIGTYYEVTLSSEDIRRCKLRVSASDKDFAASLQKGQTISTHGWMAELDDSPPWEKLGRTLYRSVAEFQRMHP